MPANDGDTVLVVKPTPTRAVMWACLVFFTFCAVMSIRAGQAAASPVFILFAALSLYVLLTTGPLEVGRDSVTYRTPWARYRIGWDEVSHIEMDEQGGGIVFGGEGKRLAALGPMYWGEKDKAAALRLLAAEVERRRIEVRRTRMALFRLSKKTKV